MSAEPWSSRLGMLRRLSRVFGSDGKSLLIAADHRQRGIQRGMEDFHGLVSSLRSALEFADGLITTREPMAHILTHSPEIVKARGLLLSLNRSGLADSAFEMDDRPVADPRTAVRWGLDGAKFLVRINPKSPDTSSQLETCGRICDICERLELPLILEPLHCTIQKGRLLVDSTPDKIRYAAIIAGDFSVPALKIPYPEGPSRSARRKSLRDIIGSVNSRVLVLGGRKGSLKNLLVRAEDSTGEGGSGVVIGRNILQHDKPALVACALRKIIHGGECAETALRKANKEICR